MKKVSESSSFTTYQNHRTEPYFSFLKDGRKTIEGRLRRGEYTNLKTGDHIIVQNDTKIDSVEVIVQDVRRYPNFQAMLQTEELAKILPNISSVDEASRVYNQFYTAKDEIQFGVIAIEVSLINQP